MSSSVTIGSRPDCDLVVDVPSVSGRHCRLIRKDTGLVLEDLNSTNGTFLNGERIRGAVPVVLTAADTIHLGSHALAGERLLSLIAAEPAPAISFRTAEMVIGRVAGCDHVIELPMISSRHARLFREGGRILIEDLRSSNGTFINGSRVQEPVVLKPGDEIGLGSHRVTLSGESWNPEETSATVPASEPLAGSQPPPVPSSPQLPPPIPTRGLTTHSAAILSQSWRLGALLGQAAAAAFLIVGLAGTGSTVAVLFGLGLAAVWFGLAAAVLGNVIEHEQLRAGLTFDGASALALRLLILAAVSALQCLLSWVIIANLAALKAPGFAVLALLGLASAVGLALGLLVIALSPRRPVAWALLPVLVLLMCLFAGYWRPVDGMPAAAGVVSSFLPSRWAFEGLVLLEADQADPAIDRDLAEPYFPAATERMGVRADSMALAAMLVGLAGAVAFIATSAKPG